MLPPPHKPDRLFGGNPNSPWLDPIWADPSRATAAAVSSPASLATSRAAPTHGSERVDGRPAAVGADVYASAFLPDLGPRPNASLLLQPRRSYRYLLYFVGKVKRLPREGDLYSHGVRQRVFSRWSSHPDFYLREQADPTGNDRDSAARGSAKFCLAPHGTGVGSGME